MKILHIAPHLGGGVGKAHSVLAAATGSDIRRHYVLLEAPRDVRFVERVCASGAEMTIAPDFATVARLAAEADIVQVEWWNHPLLYAYLCRAELPPLRSVVWCHISGLHAPYVPQGLYPAADFFLFTSPCSFEAPGVAALSQEIRSRMSVANSAFGLERKLYSPPERTGRMPVAYLGTVDFSKMSPLFFDVVDAVDGLGLTVSVWGACDPAGDVGRRARAMRHPERVRLEGYAAHPERVLATPGIFLYLLQPQHFGTAENALVEAMSLGWTPLVFDNPAEAAIVRDGETGFVEKDVSAAVRRLAWMIDSPERVARMGDCAAQDIAATRTPERLVRAFDSGYRTALARPKRTVDFGAVLGDTAADWFLSTLFPVCGGRDAVSFSTRGPASKGSFNHFLACFPDDVSLRDLATARSEAEARRAGPGAG